MAGADLRSLTATDARIEAAQTRGPGLPLTLDPARTRATSLTDLYRALAPTAEPSAAALAAGLVTTGEAILEHFPDNLFWDLDGLAAALLREARDPDHLRDLFEQIEQLMALYGRHSEIRFRYAHDFVYGFDWAKWVGRDPAARAGTGPFDEAHLRALRIRGHELLSLIAADDAKYGRLPDEGARNPFLFSREPADELVLHRALAADNLVPVRAWLLDPAPSWDRPYAALRTARAGGRQDER